MNVGFKMRSALTSLISSSISAELQSMSVISPEPAVAAVTITELLPSVGEIIVHCDSCGSNSISGCLVGDL